MLKHTIHPIREPLPQGIHAERQHNCASAPCIEKIQLTHGRGRYSDFAPLSRHLPTRTTKGAVVHCQERNNGAYSCGTVGDLHSIPFSARYRRTSTFQPTPKLFNVDSFANVYHFFETTKIFDNIKEKICSNEQIYIILQKKEEGKHF